MHSGRNNTEARRLGGNSNISITLFVHPLPATAKLNWYLFWGAGRRNGIKLILPPEMCAVIAINMFQLFSSRKKYLQCFSRVVVKSGAS